ncbi:beta-1,6-N-acetylglucosaminyltransferase [Mucilaginibacter terrae]|uniref:beta-1,6-N-acetylglucosaminyltransferase n=1 Tax=Mucilaginibacter terrae TaxID=1955052 RepID=UPI00363EE839
MKIAHLILAHNNPRQLEKLVRRLIYADDAVYIHLDKKAPIDQYTYLKSIGNVYFVTNRVKVTWGANSIVGATINGFQQIINTGIAYDYVNLLSGSDYPLQKPDQVHAFFSQNMGKVFMSYMPILDEWQEAIARITCYHFTDFSFTGRFILQRLVNKILPKRTMPNNLIPVGHSQWFTVPTPCIQYILDYWKQNANFRRFIKLTWGPDEFVFQTILYNSPYQDQMVNDNLRLIDWSAGGASPKTFTMADKEALLQSDKLFARKFDLDQHADIMMLIDQGKLDNQNELVSA